MEANAASLLTLLRNPKQFVVPIFQRAYRWEHRQCSQLWDDIVRCAGDDAITGHFIGPIVYMQEGVHSTSMVPELTLVDGQQRLATVSILLATLARALDATGGESDADEIRRHLIYNNESGELRYKVLLTGRDRKTLCRVIDGEDPRQGEHSTRVAENAAFFEEKIRESNLDPGEIYAGTKKLMLVDISLDRTHDDAQLIFESLNSTGLDLSQADLVRNYLLMGLETDDQTKLYEDQWRPMEEAFGRDDYAATFDAFMRDFLTVRERRIPKKGEVYPAFKRYAQHQGDVVAVTRDMRHAAEVYARFALRTEENPALRDAFDDLDALRVDVARPFLLEMYEDHERGVLSTEHLLDAVRLIESYVFRRAVCAIPTNTLNRTFATLMQEVDKADYLQSLRAALLLKDSHRRFPRDDEFRRDLVTRDMYNFRTRNYWLRRIENHDRKERVQVDDYTIEHIMPQNPNLPDEWRQALAEPWQEQHQRYLHTLGNLTLTRYNPEMSDRPFMEKREHIGGFRRSPLNLNEGLGQLERWTPTEIEDRANRLARIATDVWGCPILAPEELERFRRPNTDSPLADSLDHFENLSGRWDDLFAAARRRILNLDASVVEEIHQGFIGYRTDSLFAAIRPQKLSLRLTLDIPIAELVDPKGLTTDVSGKSYWVGDALVRLSRPEDLDDVMDIVRQAFAFHADGGGAYSAPAATSGPGRVEPTSSQEDEDDGPDDMGPSREGRYLGALLGLAVGDALGTTLEFATPGQFEPITDMVGGGPFGLQPGQWTDDTSMALCLAESLLECGRADPRDQLRRYTRWWREGHLSSTDTCFDIGVTISTALRRFETTDEPYCGPTGERTAGNGSIMRLAPVAMFFGSDYSFPAHAIERCAQSSYTTHGLKAPADACRYMGALLVAALEGASKEELLASPYEPSPGYWERHPLCPEIAAIAKGSFLRKNPPEISGSGYVVNSLEAALWAFHRSDDFREGCLLAANLGEDADTTAAIYGQIAGAFYGVEGTPAEWLDKVACRELIEATARRLDEARPGYDAFAIGTDELLPDLIPPPTAGWDAIGGFALSFDGYAYSEDCADISSRIMQTFATTGAIDDDETLEDLRAALFFEQRAARHQGDAPEGEGLRFGQAVVAAIRQRVSS
jgi:uncharacterized protein with ParB-like and HNH nuclease domain/ADP-ribosylglycohydrolase/predicted transport protein